MARGKSEILRHGWPDFLLRRKRDNRLFGVEVKSGQDILRPAQEACFAALEAGGIPVFVWNPQWPTRFTPWRKYRVPQKMPQRAKKRWRHRRESKAALLGKHRRLLAAALAATSAEHA